MCVIILFILLHTDPTGSWRQLVYQACKEKVQLPFSIGYPPPAVRPCGALPSQLIMCSPAPRIRERKRKARQGKDKAKVHSMWGLAPPLSTGSTSSTSAPPASAAKETNAPTFVSRRKARTGGIALSSPKSVLIREALW